MKDAYENEVAEIKEKRRNVWCHLTLTLDATTLMLMIHDCVEDDEIWDEAKAGEFSPERFQSVEKPTVDAFLIFMPIKSVVRNPNGESSRMVGRDLQSQDFVSVSRCTEWEHSFTFKKRNSCMKLETRTSDTTGVGNILAHWLGSLQKDVGSSNPPRNKDQQRSCETRRKTLSRADVRYKT